MSKQRPLSESLLPRSIMGGRIPPQDIAMEQAILGAVILQKDAIYTAMEYLKTPDPLYKEANKLVYRACLDLAANRKPIDMLTVKNKLESSGRLEAAGGFSYIMDLTSKVASAANLAYHCEVVVQKFIQRSRIVLAQKMMDDAFDETSDPFVGIERDRKALDELVPDGEAMQEAADLVVPVLEDVEAAIRGESKSIYIGFGEIDKNYAFEPGELVLILADSGTGKTAFSWQVAKRIRKRYPRIPVIFNCLEMVGKQLVARDMASSNDLSQMRMRTGKGIGKDEIARMATMGDEYSGIYTVMCWTNESLALKVRQIRKQWSLKETDPVVVVGDNLQIMVGEKAGNREQEVASIGRGAKILAADKNVLYIMLGQVNDDSKGNRPTKKNCRESKAPGNDSDWVLVLYSPSNNGQDRYDGGESTKNTIEVILDKVRFGRPGAVVKLHMSDYGLIGDMPNDDYDTELRLAKIEPKVINFGESRHSDEQPKKEENKGGGDFFPF